MKTHITGIVLGLCITSGCVQMKDYVGVRHGAFGVDMKRGFGPGTEKKEYYLTGDYTGLVRGSSEREIRAHLGSPAEIGSTLEGYTRWVYKEPPITLYLKDGYLYEWKTAKPGSAEAQ
ncbi:MAG: hypothetical protein GF333_07875 [Candidatus Omnitrophica bacterium]|nr:hypothetical protein [Candidatus Omnitrophota bacterium]